LKAFTGFALSALLPIGFVFAAVFKAGFFFGAAFFSASFFPAFFLTGFLLLAAVFLSAVFLSFVFFFLLVLFLGIGAVYHRQMCAHKPKPHASTLAPKIQGILGQRSC